MRHAIITASLNAGLALAKQSELASAHPLIEEIRPDTTDKPLIRLGSEADGGYLVPDDLEGIVACFSPDVDA